jgi:uncharacterized RDD family membrane protein YckC
MNTNTPIDSLNIPEEDQVTYASFGKRFWASLLDGIILYFIQTMVLSLLKIHQFNRFDYGLTTVEMFSIVLKQTSITLIVNAIYFAAWESSVNMASPGKMALKIYVTGSAGNRLSFIRVFGRNIGKNVSSIILGIGYLMCLWTDKKQCLHDIMADTVVVNR